MPTQEEATGDKGDKSFPNWLGDEWSGRGDKSFHNFFLLSASKLETASGGSLLLLHAPHQFPATFVASPCGGAGHGGR